jgi:hypothetical protein
MTDTVHQSIAPWRSIERIPAEIVRAICQVQSSIKSVARDGKNAHGGYHFASTDAIYAALALKLGEVGLAILCLEEAEPDIRRIEKDGKTQQWGLFRFSFVLATEAATWSDPRWRRTLMVQITGPQTFMTAQSYAEKSLLRSLFKIPTGDMDLDALPQAETEEDQAALVGSGIKRKSSAAAKRDGTDRRFNDLCREIQSCATPEALQVLRTARGPEIDELPERWKSLVDDEYATRMDDLRGRTQ